MSQRRLVLAFPGALETRTGGYVYDRRLAEELEVAGWEVRRLSLGDGFPFPDRAAKAKAAARLAALPDGTTVLVDGLALGALPKMAEVEAARLDLLALVHHPLCLETGLEPGAADALEESERAALAAVRAVVVTSARTAATVASRFGVPPARITVAPPGTEPVPPARGSGGPGCRMLSVGTVTPRKGHALLVEALAGMGELAWSLDVAGSTERDPATAEALAELIARHGLGDRIHLLGELGREALGRCYETADLFVSASLFEGYGMALADALARGLPVVAADGGAVADTLPAPAGLLVPAGDVAALAAALRRILTEPGLADRLRQGARAAASALPRWPETAAAVAAVLEGR